MFRALRRTIDDQYRCRSREDVKNADERFLAYKSGQVAGQRQQCRADRREQQRVGKGGGARGRMTDGESHGRTQRRQLRQREIGKNDLPAQYMHAQISVD